MTKILKVTVHDKALDPETSLGVMGLKAKHLGADGKCAVSAGHANHRYVVCHLDNKTSYTVEFGRYNGPNAKGTIKVTANNYQVRGLPSSVVVTCR